MAKPSQVLLVAEAWRGRNIADAIRHFLELESRCSMSSACAAGEHEFEAGGAAHLIVFVGHNGLMDFAAPPLSASDRRRRAPHASVVLACLSDSYFTSLAEQ